MKLLIALFVVSVAGVAWNVTGDVVLVVLFTLCAATAATGLYAITR